MKKLFLSIVTALSMLFVYATLEVRPYEKVERQLYHFVWDEISNEWNEVPSPDDLPDCGEPGPLNCSATSDDITPEGQPTGDVTIRTKQSN